jgi:hypothetical protein
MANKSRQIYWNYLFFYSVIFMVLFPCLLGCMSSQVISLENTREDFISVILNVTEEIKLEVFQNAVIRYFRRYNPTLQNDNAFSIQYGRFPVKVLFANDKVFIESAIPEKHSSWLLNIRKQMQTHLYRINKVEGNI